MSPENSWPFGNLKTRSLLKQPSVSLRYRVFTISEIVSRKTGLSYDGQNDQHNALVFRVKECLLRKM